MNMRKKILTLLTICLICFQMVSCSNRSKSAAPAATDSLQTETVTDIAPDFSLPDLQGNALSLSSLRGKYVVLDFWGSWCIWCIRGIPHMKEAYTKHKDRMEILGIDCQDTEDKWKAAVEQYELPWLQVRCPDDKLSVLAKQYQIEGFPTKAVVDPEGHLLKVVSGEDPAFYTYLDELFAQ